MRSRPASLLSILAVLGCVHGRPGPEMLAALSADLACPANKLEAVEKPTRVYAMGCGRFARYQKEIGALKRVGEIVEVTPTTVLPFSEVFTEPWLIGNAPILYEAGRNELVSLKCVITAQGEVRRCRILSGSADLAVGAMHAVRSWRYRPATLWGRPVAVEYVLNVRYVTRR